MKTSLVLASMTIAFTLSASCFAKDEITIDDLVANPKVYEGKEFSIRCVVSSVDLGSAYCGEGKKSISLSARTMDKTSLAFALAHCAKPNASDNDPRCQDVVVKARLKDASNPRWLDNVKMKFKKK